MLHALHRSSIYQFYSLWFKPIRTGNLWSTALETSMLTITPLVWLTSIRLITTIPIHWPRFSNLHVYFVKISVKVCDLLQFYLLFIFVWHLKIYISSRKWWDHINWFNSATFLRQEKYVNLKRKMVCCNACHSCDKPETQKWQWEKLMALGQAQKCWGFALVNGISQLSVPSLYLDWFIHYYDMFCRDPHNYNVPRQMILQHLDISG